MRIRRTQRNESGFIVAFFALLVPILIGLLALTIDLPQSYSYKTNIKSAVDLATLAGISQLQTQSDVTLAKTTALTYLNNNLAETLPNFSNLTLSSPGLTVQVGIFDFSTNMFTWDESNASVNAIQVSYTYQTTSSWLSYYMISSPSVTSSATAAKYYAGVSSAGTAFPLAIADTVITSAISTPNQRIYQFGMSTNSYFTAFDNNANVNDIENTIDYFQNMGGTPSVSVMIGDQFKYNSGALATAYLYINLIFPWTLPGNTFVFPVVTKGSGNSLTADGFVGATINNFGIGSMGYYMDITISPKSIDNTWGGLQPGGEPINLGSSEKNILSTAYQIVE